MKRVAPVRRELGIRTIFNILGPLINPARAKRQLVGVFNRELMELYTEVLLQTGARRAMIVHAMTAEGIALDEPSLNGPTHIVEIHRGTVTEHTVYPEDFGLARHSLSEIQGGERDENARIIRQILDGSAPAAHRDAPSSQQPWPVMFPEKHAALMMDSTSQERRSKVANRRKNLMKF
jgi:anthranilate phosphoribosyltransferase